MAYLPKDDPKFPPATTEAPKVYDVLDESDVWLSVWAGDGQLASIKVNGQPALEDGGVWTLKVGAASVVKNTAIAVDAEVAHTNPSSSKGSLTIAAYQFHAPDFPINRKKWVVTWAFDASAKLLAETVHAR